MRGFFAFSAVALTAIAVWATGQPASDLTFIPFGAGLPSRGQWREGFRVADLNGDGHPDIVHGAPRKQSSYPVIFLGDGKGAFRLWKEARFPDLPYDYGDVEVADLNGDGHPDLALAIHHGGIYILTGDGHGKFTNSTPDAVFGAAALRGFSSRAIRAVDWNGDGRPALVAESEGPQPGAPLAQLPGALLFLNGGSQGWRPAAFPPSRGIFSDSLTIGDFDGDGRADIASGSSVLGRSDLVILSRPEHAEVAPALPIPDSIHYVQAVAAADFDNDGRADLAIGYLALENETWYSIIDVYFSRGRMRWDRAELLKERSRDGAVAMATGHLRHRRTLDLVGVTTQGQTIVFLGDGHGKFDRDSSIPVYPGGCRGAHLEIADLDGDGLDEIVASFADEPNGAGPAAVCPSGGGITAWKAVHR